MTFVITLRIYEICIIPWCYAMVYWICCKSFWIFYFGKKGLLGKNLPDMFWYLDTHLQRLNYFTSLLAVILQGGTAEPKCTKVFFLNSTQGKKILI